MKKGLIILGVICGIILILTLWIIGTQRGLVSKQENIKESWSAVEVQYQRRLDLIPNIVNTVKSQAKNEKDIFVQLSQARNMVSNANTMDEKVQANEQVGQVLGRLIAVVENYPNLKQNEGFENLRLELEGTENKIATARNYYNDTVRTYNKKIKMFPTSIIASKLGFIEEYKYIKAEDGANKPVQVNLDN